LSATAGGVSSKIFARSQGEEAAGKRRNSRPDEAVRDGMKLRDIDAA
jgi:hypothetical protein